MAASLKFICLIGLLVFVNIATIGGVDGAGECGKSTPDDEAMKLAPCETAAKDKNAAVSRRCCAQVKKIARNPNCLCAILLSNTLKESGIKPQVAITIPKRCNFTHRSVGSKCGHYTVP